MGALKGARPGTTGHLLSITPAGYGPPELTEYAPRGTPSLTRGRHYVEGHCSTHGAYYVAKARGKSVAGAGVRGRARCPECSREKGAARREREKLLSLQPGETVCPSCFLVHAGECF